MNTKHTPHTPGPWYVTGKGLSRYVEGCVSPGVLQEVAWCGATEVAEQMEANARLIAAAPDLLEALNTLVSRIEYYSGLKDDERPNIEQWEYTNGSGDMAAARAAIEKATGAIHVSQQ